MFKEKRKSSGKRFDTDEEVKTGVNNWLSLQKTEFYEDGIKKIVTTLLLIPVWYESGKRQTKEMTQIVDSANNCQFPQIFVTMNTEL